jgi:hypothetical protein
MCERIVAFVAYARVDSRSFARTKPNTIDHDRTVCYYHIGSFLVGHASCDRIRYFRETVDIDTFSHGFDCFV